MVKHKIFPYPRIDPGSRTLLASRVTLNKLTDNLHACGPRRGQIYGQYNTETGVGIGLDERPGV